MITVDNQLYYFGNIPYETNGRDNPYNNYDNRDIVQDYRPHLFPFPEPIKQVAFGELHQFILSTKGEVYAMGINDDGQLGRPVLNTIPDDEVFEPLKLDLPVPIVSISADVSSAAAISETGRLFVWGRNTIIDHKNPNLENAILPTEVDIGSPVNYVSISDYSFIAVTQDGAVNFSVRS
uniref:Regulator of chromosome condensation protein n=1 Tax=Pithovirus LCPAC202 TaxID=2506592 RepID=A0A481Z638_9VIRU|nr:MAG: regulator of chromosome condensation protein [Pithovirus LCPAC202]